MEYGFVGFLIPAKNENDANSIINQIDHIIAESECDLSNSYSIAGIPTINNVDAFCKDFEQLLAKYIHKNYTV